MLQQFTKRLKTPFGYADFFFNPIFSVAGVRYHVAVTDESSKSVFFDMDVKDGGWYIINAPKVPGWVMNLQSELSKYIIEQPLD